MIVLMTDFGESEYVGAMKGVILSIAPTARIVDLTHSISPQSVREGAWVLLQNFHHFPFDTLFVCVVDPGVGTNRDAVYVHTSHYRFIGPDNGLLYPAVHKDGVKQIHSLSIDEKASSTFHGRDVFAVAAAHLETQTTESHLGPQKTSLDVELKFHLKEREGEVVRVDRFGNIITNLPPVDFGAVTMKTNAGILHLSHCRTYHEGPHEGVFIITGSSNTLEISAKNTRASGYLDLHTGDRLTIE
ncbi:MAG: S-adenosyl-l-methionine hydroxide adenosyltransferase family protein [Candidatus Thorarchaeota archaeon]